MTANFSGGSHVSNLDAIESNIVVVQEMETIQQSAKAKLEETCVMVTGEDVHFVPHMEGKRRPYKVHSPSLPPLLLPTFTGFN